MGYMIPTMPVVPFDMAPAMPTAKQSNGEHREHIPLHHMPVYACVARDVPPKERLSNPKAKASLDIEWERLRKAGKEGCWDEKHCS